MKVGRIEAARCGEEISVNHSKDTDLKRLILKIGGGPAF